MPFAQKVKGCLPQCVLKVRRSSCLWWYIFFVCHAFSPLLERCIWIKYTYTAHGYTSLALTEAFRQKADKWKTNMNFLRVVPSLDQIILMIPTWEWTLFWVRMLSESCFSTPVLGLGLKIYGKLHVSYVQESRFNHWHLQIRLENTWNPSKWQVTVS